MGKKILSILTFSLSLQAFGQIRLYNNQIEASDSTFTVSPIQVIVSTENTDNAPWAFIPISNNSGSDADLNNLYTDIPEVVAGSANWDALFVNNPKLGFYVENKFNGSRKIAMYVKPTSSGDWIAIKILDGDNGSNYYKLLNQQSFTSFHLSLKELCSLNSNSVNCYTAFNSMLSGNTANVKTSQYVYIKSFDTISTPGEVPPTISDPSSSSENTGVLIKLLFSSNIVTPPFPTTGIHRGDTSLALDYNGTVTSGSFDPVEGLYKVIIVNLSSAVATGTFENLKDNMSPPKLCLVPPAVDIVNNGDCYILGPNTNLAGTVSAYNLLNGSQYELGVILANKYKLTSKIGETVHETPQEIQTFLKEQSCFFLSAGFQEEHFVLNYFRKFRDLVLLPSRFGKSLVNFYYQTAPSYTHYIYENPFFSMVMRGFGHALYWIFNSILALASFLSAFIVHRSLKRKFQ
ncbi:MAG: CFI-box-CTERM domain-containing protein [Bacteriovoracaceae bacterium]